ncbi:MAG: type I pullulanase [Firmicutes bacterium]|nr:type I pullulanase [Bacillota bacterium]MTI68662.1 type I pullulanase [Bacillota bacterium]
MLNFSYKENELGAIYYKDYTIFKVYSPDADNLKVVIYETSSDNIGKSFSMIRNNNGIWYLKLKGDYKNKYYNYKVTIDNKERETPDPYTKGACENGKKGMIVDFNSLNPKGWVNHRLPKQLKNTESIIYEMHIKDFSISKDSGMKHKGKYLAFTEKNTKGVNGIKTGIDHLVELGITHLHLMPVYDFISVDETKGGYNWGYDPYLYNVLEGSYSTNPYDGRVRIKEFKEMIKILHENNIRVIIDVVYNHTFSINDSPFNILAPNYYYRRDKLGNFSNGSGCGNEIATEKPMARKFIIDSVLFWAKEYKIDGFRFDLMKLIDIDTLKTIKEKLHGINPNILIYGEPWSAGETTLEYDKQIRKGKQKNLDIALFNDEIRNALKGDNDGVFKGFVNGGYGFKTEVKKGIVGSIFYNNNINGFTEKPNETINYVSCHDNLCLFDKFEKSNPNDSEKDKEKMNRLALSIILTSQGIPFIQGGSEFLRTKKGVENSYNSGDEINEIKWSRKDYYKENFQYIKGLINLRKRKNIMTLTDPEKIRRYLTFIDNDMENVIMYQLKNQYENLVIIHNSNREEINIKLPEEGIWKVLANNYLVNIEGINVIDASKIIKVKPISTYIFEKEN